MARAVIAVVLLLGAAVFGIMAFDAAMANAGEDYLVTNETWTPSAGSVTQLENSELAGGYYDNSTNVYDQSGAEVDRGTDYEWFQNNGTVKALVGGALDGDSSANITYAYQQTSAEQRALAGLVARLPQLLAVLVPLFGLVILLLILGG